MAETTLACLAGLLIGARVAGLLALRDLSRRCETAHRDAIVARLKEQAEATDPRTARSR